MMEILPSGAQREVAGGRPPEDNCVLYGGYRRLRTGECRPVPVADRTQVTEVKIGDSERTRPTPYGSRGCCARVNTRTSVGPSPCGRFGTVVVNEEAELSWVL